VHGDLKALSILVSEDGVLKVSRFDDSILSNSALGFSAATGVGGGSLRWMAPELLLRTEDETAPPAWRNKQTDVYALGMTMLEIITGKVPYSEYRNDVSIIRALDKKQLPVCPEELQGPNARAELMWTALRTCLYQDPAARPTAAWLLTLLRDLAVEDVERVV